MNQKKEQPQQQKKASQQVIAQALDSEAQTDGLVARAREVQTTESLEFESSPLLSQYAAALAAQVEIKHDQVERIEDKLENMIEQQASRLQQCRSQQPGMIAFPSARSKWQQQLLQQQSTLQKLQGRLEIVREIKDGIGVHGARIEEMACHKLRIKEPGLASEWDELQEAQRLHQALQRKQKNDQERAQREKQGMGSGLGLSHTLTIGTRA